MRTVGRAHDRGLSLGDRPQMGIDLDTTITTPTSASVTGIGAIDINDTAGGLIVTSATTANGAITLNATGGDSALATVTANGTANILATTTTSGNIFVGNVSAIGDTITLTAIYRSRNPARCRCGHLGEHTVSRLREQASAAWANRDRQQCGHRRGADRKRDRARESSTSAMSTACG